MLRLITPAWVLVQTALAGQSTLTTTFQPLYGHATSDIVIAEVTCLHWYANGVGSAVDLIALRNVPPTDNPEQAKEDLNLASVCGLKFSTNDLGVDSPPLVVMDATRFVVSKQLGEVDPESLGKFREKIVRASLECLRRCLPTKLAKTPLTLRCGDADREWLGKITEEFNAHDRTKVFFASSGG